MIAKIALQVNTDIDHTKKSALPVEPILTEQMVVGHLVNLVLLRRQLRKEKERTSRLAGRALPGNTMTNTADVVGNVEKGPTLLVLVAQVALPALRAPLLLKETERRSQIVNLVLPVSIIIVIIDPALIAAWVHTLLKAH